MIYTRRMLDLFLEMVRISSLSKNERNFCDFLKPRLIELGGEVYEDKAGEAIGGNCGNLIVTFPENSSEDIPRQSKMPSPLILNAHLDTVPPGEGIIPLEKEGRIVSAGNTILGADDKAGIAIILEILKVMDEKKLPKNNIEVVLSVAEETGLLGAKNLEHERLKGKFCVAFDSKKSSSVVTRAPAANRIIFHINGKEAHAGACPEEGISAIKIAAEAISKMSLGRLDGETTANIGIIQGGVATNVVPGQTIIKGEARSHNTEKLERQTRKMRDCVKEAAVKYSEKDSAASFYEEIYLDFPLLNTPEDGTLVTHIKQAANEKKIEINIEALGGGSDANIFQSYGWETVIMGIGADYIHTTEETLYIEQIKEAAQLALSIVENWI